MKIKNLAHFFHLFIVCGYFPIVAQSPDGHPDVVTPAIKGKPPSDAVFLFSGGDLNAFESVNGGPADWNVRGKKFIVNPGTGNIQTKQRFGDCQLHVEWRTPKKDVKEGKKGQQNGNSGIYLMGKYEVQVLNSYINETDPDRQAGAVYSQHAPLVNASLPAGRWQVYDIIFIAPKFNRAGEQVNPGYVTVLHNGVVIQHHAEIQGPTVAASTQFDITEAELPMMLQDHTNEVSYRNIWIRKL